MLVKQIEISFNSSQLYTEDVQALVNDMNNTLPNFVAALQELMYVRTDYSATTSNKAHSYSGGVPMKVGFRSGRGYKGHFGVMGDSTADLTVVRVPDILAQFTSEEQIAMIGSGNLRLNENLRRGLVAELSSLFLPTGLRTSIFQWRTANFEDHLVKNIDQDGSAASSLFLATMRSLAAHPVRFEQRIKKPDAEARRISQLSHTIDYLRAVQQAHPSVAYYRLKDTVNVLTQIRDKLKVLSIEDPISQHIVEVQNMMGKLPAITTAMEALMKTLTEEINKEQSK